MKRLEVILMQNMPNKPKKVVQEYDEDEPWLFNRGNLIFLAVVIVFAGWIGWLQYRTHMIQAQDAKQVKLMHKWQNKVDALVEKNDRTIYLPKAGDAHLTKTQQQGITQLTQLFVKITNFNNPTGYQTAYNYAKSIVSDQSFFDNFLTAPKDKDGGNVVTGTNIKLSNVRTEVLVTGSDTYTVIVTYIPYHAHSDLYQRQKLQTRSRIFNVQGTPGHWTKCEQATDMDPNAITYHVSDIE